MGRIVVRLAGSRTVGDGIAILGHQPASLKQDQPIAVQGGELQVVVADLDKAFQAFFRRVKAGQTPGYPRFRGRNRFAGFGFKETATASRSTGGG